MPPADDFSDDYGWNDELIQRRERRRKAKGKERLDRIDKAGDAERPRKDLERRSRQNRDWDDEYSDEY